MTNPPGAMPPLPEPGMVSKVTGLKYYGDDQMHAYAKSYAAPLIARAAALQEALESTNSALEAIGDYAHTQSTGPALWDPLWEIRSMAYNGLCFVDEPAELKAAP